MNIQDVKYKAIRKLFDNSILNEEACLRIIENSFEILLEEIEKAFDETDNKMWHGFELSDCFHSFREELKAIK